MQQLVAGAAQLGPQAGAAQLGAEQLGAQPLLQPVWQQRDLQHRILGMQSFGQRMRQHRFRWQQPVLQPLLQQLATGAQQAAGAGAAQVGAQAAGAAQAGAQAGAAHEGAQAGAAQLGAAEQQLLQPW